MAKVNKARKRRNADLMMKIIVDEFGVHETLAALCRQCNDRGMPVLFRKLNRVYEWLVT